MDSSGYLRLGAHPKCIQPVQEKLVDVTGVAETVLINELHDSCKRFPYIHAFDSLEPLNNVSKTSVYTPP